MWVLEIKKHQSAILLASVCSQSTWNHWGGRLSRYSTLTGSTSQSRQSLFTGLQHQTYINSIGLWAESWMCLAGKLSQHTSLNTQASICSWIALFLSAKGWEKPTVAIPSKRVWLESNREDIEAVQSRNCWGSGWQTIETTQEYHLKRQTLWYVF